MADRTDNVLLAAIRSLEQVVAPAAAASGDPMATEQAALVVRHLRFLRERGPLQYERSRYELDYHLRLARQVGDVLAHHDRADPGLDHAVARAASARETDVGPAELEAAAAGLRSALSRVVRLLGEDDPAAGQAVDDVVLAAAEEFLDFERAWFLPQGWDPDEAAVPALGAFLPGAGQREEAR